jgi:uncharacterized protein with HEPN domain
MLPYVRDIAECIERIESYTCGGREAFMQTRMIQDAVVRNFEIIGEATKRLSQELKQKNSDIQWQQIAGFRDVLIHDYIRVDLDEVWGTIERALPVLKAKIKVILQELGEEM